MKTLLQFKTPIPPVANSINRSGLRRAFLLILLVLVCFGLSPAARAQLPSPSPDGSYPGNNTAEGYNALFNLTTGIANTAVGYNALLHNTTGGWNVGVGSSTLASNTTGSFNMAIGTDALTHNIANYNLAIGFRVGYMNTYGNHLTGIGPGALFSNTLGSYNTAIGSDALRNNTTGGFNTAIGSDALGNNTTTDNNTAVGAEALGNNTTGTLNAAVGREALLSNTIGIHNTAIGADALRDNTTGGFNIAVGDFAGTGLTTGSDNIDIGSPGLAGEHDTIRIGGVNGIATFIGGIYAVNEGSPAVQVYVSSGGQLGTVASSQRFKKDIATMDKASEAILALKPVRFHYKSDKTSTPQFGLIAEEVAKVNPDLIVRDKNGDIYSVRYDAVNAMLLNEFLKEHRKVEQLEATLAQQQTRFHSEFVEQQKQIGALTAGLQRVSEQLEMGKPAPQVVNNNQ